MALNTEYDLVSLPLPRLSGLAFRLVAGLLDGALTRPLLLGMFLDNGGITGFRRQQFDGAPVLMPLAAAPAEAAGPPPDLAHVPADRVCERQDFSFNTVWDYAHAYREGIATPEEVAGRLLAAIEASEAHDPALRAFIAVNPDEVWRMARESTERIRAGRAASIFDGVPVAVKDEVDMRPYPTTVGTRFLGSQPVASDSTVVARMRAAGALLIGKANMHEIGILPTGLNAHHGAARNPYNPRHDTGGSSSGPAAAVAAGLCPVAIGADGGGSIRIPASFCGIVGIKASFGRISEHGAAPLCWSVAHVGPLAATAEDAALAYAVMAGPDPLDPISMQQPPHTIEGYSDARLDGVRLGICRPWFEHAAPEVVAACEQAAEQFRARGAEIVEVRIPGLDAMRVAHVIAILSEMTAAMARYDAAHRRDFELNTQIMLSMARAFTSSDYVKAQQVRAQALRAFDEVFANADAILSPAAAIPAPPIPEKALPQGESDTSTVTEMMRYAFPANLTGLPAISFPVGYTAAGLPVGMQAMGRHWEEHLLLRLAFTAEQFVPRRRPAVYTDLLG
jgi:Asp-tRNA(Asn)/Glu-tRNA(Gln) amidotransferase A subunit family amidase